MIKSMTGFGRGEFNDGKRSISVEMKAVNHRYCEIAVRLPRRYSFAEEHIKSIIRETVRRGKVDVSILVDNITEEDSVIRLNRIAARQYYDNLQALKQEFDLAGEVGLELLAMMPDVVKAIPDVEDEAALLAGFAAATRQAVAGFETMRQAEGEKLAEDILARGGLIESIALRIESFGPDIVRDYTEKLRDRIAEMTGSAVEIPEERIVMEAAFFADKANITEELVRLRSHLTQLKSLLFQTGQPGGRKLDFLVQEMNRETNTIGSKANDIRITNDVLEMKSEVEKIREQVQNIE